MRPHTVLLTALTLMSGCAHSRTGAPARVQASAIEIECAPATLTFNYQALVDRFRSMSRDERRLCLNRLLDVLRPPEPTLQAEYLARGIVELARQGLVEDGAVLRLLIECQSRHLNSLGTSCNQATVALTRHPYGQTFFAQQRGAPAFTVDNRDRIVADWRELDRLLEDGHPVFDSLLADECASAIRAVGARLVETLTAAVPHHPVLGYLGNIPNEASTILKKQGQAERIFSFAIGGPSAGPGFAVPGNWIDRGPLQGIRILMFRPGIPNPVSGRPSPEIQGFPAADSDYHEVFNALDLEVRFQIITSSDDLRRTTIDAVKQALNGLRRVNVRGSGLHGNLVTPPGRQLQQDADESTTGPASVVAVDPNGNLVPWSTSTGTQAEVASYEPEQSDRAEVHGGLHANRSRGNPVMSHR